jgi:hypothetical protein
METTRMLHLINGEFQGKEALDLITHLVHVKIKFLENKIEESSSEEDIKMREKRIKQLQEELSHCARVLMKTPRVHLESNLEYDLA